MLITGATTPAHLLSQPLTLRDALHTAISFDVFNRHADKVAMANVAQSINCIHSLFLAEGDRYTRTPVYYVFELYRNHMRSKLARMRIRCPELQTPSGNAPSRNTVVRNGQAAIPGLSGSASVKGDRLTVTITNPALDSSVSTRIRLTAGSVAQARGTALTHADRTARNTFDRPSEVRPSPLPVQVSAGGAEVMLPARSVVALELGMTS